MKKRWISWMLMLAMALSLLPANVLAADGVAVNAANFPDAVFRGYVSQNFDTDASGSLSKSEIAAAANINVSGKGISSLEGIAYFTSLSVLDCGRNQLTVLDVSKCSKLTKLFCDGNKLRSLDVSGCTALSILTCYNNNFTSLDVSHTGIGR